MSLQVQGYILCCMNLSVPLRLFRVREPIVVGGSIEERQLGLVFCFPKLDWLRSKGRADLCHMILVCGLGRRGRALGFPPN
jgi:hypothetical protein